MNKEVEYIKEHLYEIYKYKKSMQDLSYDMDIEHLLRTCKALDYQQKEIEQLKAIINNAIKYIEKNTHNIYADGYRDRETGELLSIEKTPIVNRIFSKNPQELLEILHDRRQ